MCSISRCAVPADYAKSETSIQLPGPRHPESVTYRTRKISTRCRYFPKLAGHVPTRAMYSSHRMCNLNDEEDDNDEQPPYVHCAT